MSNGNFVFGRNENPNRLTVAIYAPILRATSFSSVLDLESFNVDKNRWMDQNSEPRSIIDGYFIKPTWSNIRYSGLAPMINEASPLSYFVDADGGGLPGKTSNKIPVGDNDNHMQSKCEQWCGKALKCNVSIGSELKDQLLRDFTQHAAWTQDTIQTYLKTFFIKTLVAFHSTTTKSLRIK